jgi:site-specific recombinase XerC
VPRWGTVEAVLAQCATLRERALVALMAYGGLRREEVAGLNIGDVDLEFGLRRLVGKGGHETALPLPDPARTVLAAHLAAERPAAPASAPLFVVRYRTRGGQRVERRILGQRI